MNKPEISIIMLTYNRKNFLKRSIESVLAQKNCDMEFIIVNNGSSDGSLEICKDYASRDKRVKIIDKARGNIGSGRNAGIDIARGNYISFVDDDDRMDDDMFEYLYRNLKLADADISICGCYSDFGDRLEDYYIYDGIYEFDNHQGVEELLKREKYNSANPCKLFKRELFDDVRYLDTGKYDDIHTLYKLFANSKKTVVSGLAKYYFTKHDENNSSFVVTNSLNPEQLEEYLFAFKTRTEYLTKKVPSIRDFAKVSEWSYMISMMDKIDQNKLENCYEIYNYMKEEVSKNIDGFHNSKYLSKRDRQLLRIYYGK